MGGRETLLSTTLPWLYHSTWRPHTGCNSDGVKEAEVHSRGVEAAFVCQANSCGPV